MRLIVGKSAKNFLRAGVGGAILGARVRVSVRNLFVACVGALLILSSCQRIPPTIEQGPQPGPSLYRPDAAPSAGEEAEAEPSAAEPAPSPPAELSPQRTFQLDLAICRQALAAAKEQLAQGDPEAAQPALLAKLDELSRAAVELVSSLPSLQARQALEKLRERRQKQ